MAQLSIDQAMELALSHFHAGAAGEAEHLCRLILSSQPDYTQALNLMGVLAFSAGRSDIALRLFDRSVQIDPGNVEFLCNLGNALLATGDASSAIASYQKAISLKPSSPAIFTNLGTAYLRLDRIGLAIDAHHAALEMNPEFAEAHSNLGDALVEQGNVQQAVMAYRKAIALKPDVAEFHWNLSLCLLLERDFAGGWSEFEWRLKCADHTVRKPSWPQPMWDGSALAGKTILLQSEQGFGDTLQFIRYAQLLHDRSATVIVRCQPQLIGLFSQLTCVGKWITPEEPLPAFDLWCPLMSLPNRFATDLRSIPPVLTLKADATRPANFLSRIPQVPDKWNIGLAWAGHPGHNNDRHRSIPFALVEPLTQLPNVRCISLQKGGQALTEHLIDLTDQLQDFADTAALVEHLDLVITVDTAIAHLAGSLGKTVWLMLPFAPDWRWMRDRNDSPWYPGMRLFRQTQPGAWEAVVQQIMLELSTHFAPVS